MSTEMVVKTETAVLNLDSEMTIDEHLAIGNVIADMSVRTKWNIGDWWRFTPKMEGAAGHAENSAKVRYADILERMEISVDTARDYGLVANSFQEPEIRDLKIPFSHYHKALRAGLNGEQRRQLLSQAADQKWSQRKLVEQAKIMEGKPVEEKPVSNVGRPAKSQTTADVTDEYMGQLVDKLDKQGLKKADKKKIQSAAKKVFNKLASDFDKEVAQEAKKATKERLEYIKEREEKANRNFTAAAKISAGAKAFMSQEEYRFLRGILHPDRLHSITEDKLTRGMEIMNRIGKDAGWV